MSDAVKRRIRILQYIPRRNDGSITISRIIDLLSEDMIYTNVRTVQRDMEDLSNLFPNIQYIGEEKPYHWFWLKDETLPIPAMGPYTALTFHLAEQILKPLLPAASHQHLASNFKAAKKVLDEKDKRRTRRWLKKIRVVPRSLRLISAPIRDGIYDTVTQALYDDKQLEVTYMAASSKTGTPKTYSIHPYALLHRDSTTELVGKIDMDDITRHWPLHRMHIAKVLDSKSVTPRSFDLDEYIKSALAHPLSGDQITFRAWIKKDSQAFNHVLETRLSRDQVIEYVDDGLIITATLHETAELKWWILGMADRIKVLNPAGLKNNIKNTIKNTSKLYK